jgi:hypothetical protein
MGDKRSTDLGHLQVSKLVPEILNCVQTNEGGGTKQTDPFDAGNTANQSLVYGICVIILIFVSY